MTFGHLQIGQYNKLVIPIPLPISSKQGGNNESELAFSRLVVKSGIGCLNYHIN